MSDSSSSMRHLLAGQSPRAVAGDLHPFLGIAAAGWRQHALALDLHHAGAAVAVRPHAFHVAQARNLDAVPLRGLKDRLVRTAGDGAFRSSVNETDLPFDETGASRRAVLFCVHYSTSLRKVFQNGEHRIRRGLAQTADRRVHHRLRQLLQQRGVPPLLLHQLERLDRADAAGRALAAGFVGEELHQVARGAGRGVVIRKHHNRRRPDEAAVLGSEYRSRAGYRPWTRAEFRPTLRPADIRKARARRACRRNIRRSVRAA